MHKSQKGSKEKDIAMTTGFNVQLLKKDQEKQRG
jgi:hypothetical protein